MSRARWMAPNGRYEPLSGTASLLWRHPTTGVAGPLLMEPR